MGALIKFLNKHKYLETLNLEDWKILQTTKTYLAEVTEKKFSRYKSNECFIFICSLI